MKIGLFPMVADLLHAGHLHAIEYAKQHCDYLIVAMNVDPASDNSMKHKPVETVYQRFKRLDCCRFVDKIMVYSGEEDLLRLLTTTLYDVRFVGEDHISSWTGKDYEQGMGIQHCIIPRRHNESTSNLRKRIAEQESKETSTGTIPGLKSKEEFRNEQK